MDGTRLATLGCGLDKYGARARVAPAATLFHTAIMPLRYTEDPADLNAVKNAPEQYIVFYSSRDKDGKMWCPVRTL